MVKLNIDARIEISNRCNYKCEFCPVHKQTRKKEFMFIELFMKTLYKVKDYKQITFSGMGEPMLHPDFNRFMWQAKSAGFDVLVITNGSKLTVDKFRYLNDLGVNIRISWYNKKEQRVILDEIFKLKRKIKVNIHYTPLLPGQIDSVQLIEDYKDKADLLEIWTPHNWGDTFEYREVNEQANCPRIRRSPVHINVNGDVVMCCMSWDGQLKLGNLGTQTLDEVFTSEWYQRLRKNEYGGLICENCDLRNKNKENALYFTTSQVENRTNKTSTCFEEL